MSSLQAQIDALKYGGFTSYGQGQVATLKPGISNLYNKDCYREISQYQNRFLPYFDDKIRYKSVYKEEIIDPIRQGNYHENLKKPQMKVELDNYQYTHEPNVLEIMKENLQKNEDSIRDKYAKTTISMPRKRCFSQWKTTYTADNENMSDKKEKEFTQSKIMDLYQPKYHNYHKTFYNTENVKSVGIHGDVPFEKFFNNTQRSNGTSLLYNDNHLLGLGTTKTNLQIPGYAGFMPKNQQNKHITNLNDPYTNVNKTNHILNYKTRVPRYQGHMSINPVNIKGNPRPYCLSTQDETFN